MELCSLLKRLNTEHGALTAVESESESCTYAELFDRAETLARSLRKLGCVRGTRLAFAGGSGIRFAEFLLALSQLGAELVALQGTGDSPGENVQFLFVGRGMKRALPEITADICVIGEETLPGAISYKKLCRRARGAGADDEVNGADALLCLPSGQCYSSAQLAEYALGCAENKPMRQLLPLPRACLSLARELCGTLACGGTAVIDEEFRAKDWIYAITDRRAESAFLTQTMAEAIVRDSRYLKGDFSGLRMIRCGLTLFEKETLRRMCALFPKDCVIRKEYGFPRVITRLETTPQGAMEQTSDGYTLLGSVGRAEKGVELASFRDGIRLDCGLTGDIFCRFDGEEWQPLGERGLVSCDGFVFFSRDRAEDPAVHMAEGGAGNQSALGRLLRLRASMPVRELCREAAEAICRLLRAETVGISSIRQEIIPEITASAIAAQAENTYEIISMPPEWFSPVTGWTELPPENQELVCYPLRSTEGGLFGGLFLGGFDGDAGLVRLHLTSLLEAHEAIYSAQTRCELFRQTAQLASEGVGISRVEPHPALLFANDIASEQINLARRQPSYGKMLETVQRENMYALMEPDCESSSRSFYTRVGERKLWVNYRAERVCVDGRAFAVCFSNTQDNRSSTRHLESILTKRETEIVDLLSRGASNKDMAAVLGISPNTVKYHLARIYEKMEVSGRTELLSSTYMRDYRKR